MRPLKVLTIMIDTILEELGEQPLYCDWLDIVEGTIRQSLLLMILENAYKVNLNRLNRYKVNVETEDGLGEVFINAANACSAMRQAVRFVELQLQQTVKGALCTERWHLVSKCDEKSELNME